VDGDPNRSVLTWARQGKLPFNAVEERAAARYAREYEHIVFDLRARPEEEDLKILVEGCDLLVILSKPDPLFIDALMLTINMLARSAPSSNIGNCSPSRRRNPLWTANGFRRLLPVPGPQFLNHHS
jgi:hypothetical protein